MESGTIISATIAVVSAVVIVATFISLMLKVRHAKQVTLTKKDGKQITVNTHYNKSDSRRFIEFIK